MQRFLAMVLLAVFLIQPGAALAAPRASVPVAPLLLQVQGAWQGIIADVASTQLGATLSGSGSRWTTMHAPAPIFPRVRARTHPLPNAASRRYEPKAVQYGVMLHPRGSQRMAMAMHARRDPLAMRVSHAPGSAQAVRPAFVCRYCGGFPHPHPIITPCPSGWHGSAPNCVAPTPTPRPTATPCPAGWYGSAPNCLSPTPTPRPTATPCPAGWYGSAPNCLSPTPTPRPTATPCPWGWLGSAPNCLSPTPTPVPTATPMPPLPPATTGINRWWTYAAQTLPGVGRAMVAISSGDLVVQADDVDIPERGIDLALRRTYNSQSLHDAANDDRSQPSAFGNGWTSTFDAHLAYNPAQNVLSVYDIDGARYDYTSDGHGHWIAPPGVHATLTYAGGCGYFWTKKTGTRYTFFSPVAGCGRAQGYWGRTYEIHGRNRNNYLSFNYAWVGGNWNAANNLAAINVVHSDGQSLLLTFAKFGGAAFPELASVRRPDGATIEYSYDAAGNLLEVDRPGHGSTLIEQYAYTNGKLTVVKSPRYVASWRARNGNPNDGDVTTFGYSGATIASITQSANVNFMPSDGTSTPLQSGPPTGIQPFFTTTFSGIGTLTTQMADSDGHARKWLYDSLGRVKQTSAWTGTQWLITQAQWDAENDLTATIDARGFETDYAYDANGNTVGVARPAVQTTTIHRPIFFRA